MGGFSAFPNRQNRQEFRALKCPCPHLSRQKARRWLRAHCPRGLDIRPTAPYVQDAWAPARPPLHKGRDSAWPSPPSAPRPAPPRAPACGLAREEGVEGGKERAQPLQAAAPTARGAPIAPRTYLWRPRPARAARSPTTVGRPSPPQRRLNPRRPLEALGS